MGLVVSSGPLRYRFIAYGSFLHCKLRGGFWMSWLSTFKHQTCSNQNTFFSHRTQSRPVWSFAYNHLTGVSNTTVYGFRVGRWPMYTKYFLSKSPTFLPNMEKNLDITSNHDEEWNEECTEKETCQVGDWYVMSPVHRAWCTMSLHIVCSPTKQRCNGEDPCIHMDEQYNPFVMFRRDSSWPVGLTKPIRKSDGHH